MLDELRSIWGYRHFITALVRRDFEARYQGALLGILWPMVQPIAMILVYTLVFSHIMRAKLPATGAHSDYAYGIYLCAGIIPWGLFVESLTRMTNAFVENSTFLKKSTFPRSCLFFSAILSSLLNFSIISTVFLVFLLITGEFPGMLFFAVIPVLAVQLVFVSAIGIFFGTVNVFFRDIGQSLGVVLQFWFWFTPIVYVTESLPERIQQYLLINPLAPIMRGYQDVIFAHRPPDWLSLATILGASLVIFLLSSIAYRHLAHEIVDEL
jgi:lipopolysaccharide transport system permease protein